MSETGGVAAVSEHGMVSTAHSAATAAGVQMLARGGNAVDAAVAAALALGVCEPSASGLGGQTMMLIHRRSDETTLALDGSSRAPNRALMDRFKGPAARRRRGHLATTVPSSPAVYGYALEHYGSLDWAAVIEPAIVLAEEGYEVSPLQHRLARRERKRLRARSGGRFFLEDGRRAHPVGALFRQPVLARTLRRLGREGYEDFYSGETARLVHQDMEANGGIVLADDLAQMPRPVERPALAGRFDGERLATMPLPGAGRTLIEMMNVFESLPPEHQDIDTAGGAVCLAETIRRALIDRSDRPYDPNLYSQVADKQMLSVDYARRVASEITARLAPGGTTPGPGRGETTPGLGHGETASGPGRSETATRLGHGETTHLSVMDAEGNAVALTQSIEGVYGSCEASPELGFLYNNYMSAFEYEDSSHPYHLRPNAVPWASVAPTIVFRGRQPWLVLGSPGSERITSSILQVLIRLRASAHGRTGAHSQHGESDRTGADSRDSRASGNGRASAGGSAGGESRSDAAAAVGAPRLHCSPEGVVSVEARRVSAGVLQALDDAGFELDRREAYSFYLGCVQLVIHDGGRFVGAADPRRDGTAAGPAALPT